MKRGLKVLWLLTTLGAATSLAQTPADSAQMGLDCWIGQEERQLQAHYIRCIADRDLPHPVLDDETLELLLDELHREFHQGSGAAAERLYRSKLELVRESRSLWNIRIFSYPYEWSWADGRPQRLVRAMLCPSGTACQVNVVPR
jgi:hypothetical protein